MSNKRLKITKPGTDSLCCSAIIFPILLIRPFDQAKILEPYILNILLLLKTHVYTVSQFSCLFFKMYTEFDHFKPLRLPWSKTSFPSSLRKPPEPVCSLPVSSTSTIGYFHRSRVIILEFKSNYITPLLKMDFEQKWKWILSRVGISVNLSFYHTQTYKVLRGLFLRAWLPWLLSLATLALLQFLQDILPYQLLL